jgi:hypothetical protein
MMRFILGTLALVGTLVFAFVLEGGKPLDFLLPAPLAIILGVPCFAVLAVWNLREWGQAWRDAFAPSAEGAESSAALWGFYEKACYVAGVVGFILGLNVIFQQRGGVSREDLLRPLAVDCVAPILAITFAMVARILKARVEKNARGN